MSCILVVDDDPSQLDLQKQLLESDGHQVETALTARQTVHCLEHAPPDLVIMDLRFPNAYGDKDPQEGMALIRLIRESGCGAPIMVLSGWPDDLYGAPEERQVACILVKPVSPPQLLAAVRRHCA
jgi:CheY-like chemotaxis protein